MYVATVTTSLAEVILKYLILSILFVLICQLSWILYYLFGIFINVWKCQSFVKLFVKKILKLFQKKN